MSRPYALIPARFAASRFPGKPLALISGKPMVEQVYRRCEEAQCFEQIYVATDSEAIADAVTRFGGRAILTSKDCASGSDRIAQAAQTLSLKDTDIVCNVQGDEPALHAETLQRLVAAFETPGVQMATLVRALEEHERANPNIVKAVLADDGSALLFSRFDIPFERERLAAPIRRWAHIGLYGYTWSTLRKVSALPPHVLEETESLEQLRALCHGVKIICQETPHTSVAVDRPEDVPLAEAALWRMRES